MAPAVVNMEAVIKLEIGKIYWVRRPSEGIKLPDAVQPGWPVELLAAWDSCLFVKTALGKIVSVPPGSLDP